MNPPPTFQPGQVVQLKSGGPRMTVNEVHESGVCHCMWFNGDEVHWTQIHPAALVLATNESQPTPRQPSPLNNICTSRHCSQDFQFPKRAAAALQMVISTLTGAPINITWVPDPTDPDAILGWFEVSAPLKP